MQSSNSGSISSEYTNLHRLRDADFVELSS